MKISKKVCCDNLPLIIFSIFISLLFSSCSYAPNVRVAASESLRAKGLDDIRDIAVVVDASSVDERNIEDGLYVVLLNYGYNVTARSDIKTLMKEIKFQSSGLTDADASKIGKMLNVKVVMLARGETVQKRGDKRQKISLKTIDVETGEVLTLAMSDSPYYSWFSLARGAAIKAVPPLNKTLPDEDEFFKISVGCVENKNTITSLDKIAILVKDDKSRKSADVEDIFTGFLMSQKYRIASRSDVKKALDEINFQNSGLTEQGASKIGKMLNVKAVMVVETTAFEHSSDRGVGYLTVELSARLIDIEKNKVLWVANNFGTRGGGWDKDTDAFERAISSMMKAFPKK
ncbi:MAG: hypothetical protein OEV89_07515 [Desulfobulbaceae bacterium]|nr:hypothetical protein [Desulfobulbaceae bacterium]HIJ90601.1 hypothetical protein [Deltaproteobacteria bacterium]